MIALILAGGLTILGWDGLHLPSVHLTPGETRPLTQATTCAIKWSKDVRHVTQKMKVEVCQSYDVPGRCPGPDWEIDHLIPRELGGADTVKNLWPQPIKEARKKDVLENFLHRAVCGGAMTLEQAQESIREDWTQAYRLMQDDR